MSAAADQPAVENRRRPRDEWKVLACLALLIGAFEVGMRTVGSRVSADVRHYAEMPALADKVEHGAGLRIVFLGNSLVREGIVQPLAEELLAGRGPVTVVKFNADDSSIVEWRRLFATLLAEPKRIDLLVLGYAETQLTDAALVKPRRLGGYYATTRNLSSILAEDTPKFDDAAELLLARTFRSFADAERVRLKVLAKVIPYFEHFSLWLNGTLQKPADAPQPDETKSPQFTYARLTDLLATAESSGVKVALVAIPVGYRWNIDPALVKLAAERGALHIDALHMPGVTAENFPDNYHMDAAAAEKMTRLVAERLLAWPVLEGLQSSNAR